MLISNGTKQNTNLNRSEMPESQIKEPTKTTEDAVSSALLHRLFRGLSQEDKKELASRLDITTVHLARIAQNPGLISVDRARVIMEFLEPLYGESAVVDAFNLKLVKQ